MGLNVAAGDIVWRVALMWLVVYMAYLNAIMCESVQTLLLLKSLKITHLPGHR